MPVSLTWRDLLIPLVAAFIGWITNVAAVRMLFWPRTPVRIPGTPWVLLGVFPRRRKQIASGVGEIVERMLLRPGDIAGALARNGDAYREEMSRDLERYVAERLRERLPRFLPEGVREAVAAYGGEVARREAAEALPALLEKLQQRIPEQLQVASVVSKRLGEMELQSFEAVILRVVGRELRVLEILGGVLGFVIGLVQLALARW